jgi:hypothetical protein
MLTDGLVTYLTGQANVTAIVGSRIRPIPAPEDISQYPMITYQGVSDVSGYTLSGADGVTDSRIIFNCHASRYLDARNTALAVKKALTGYSGTLPDGTQIFQAHIVNMVDGFEDGSRMSKVSVHVLITYSD